MPEPASPSRGGSSRVAAIVIGAVVVVAAVVGGIVLATSGGDDEAGPADTTTTTDDTTTTVDDTTTTGGPVTTAEAVTTTTTAPTTTTEAGPPGCDDVVMAESPWACLSSARIENGTLFAEFEGEFAEPLSVDNGLHLHLFGNSIPPEDAGTPGPGPWLVWDRSTIEVPLPNESLSPTLDTSDELCVRVADARPDAQGFAHALVREDNGNCIPIERG